MGDTVIKLRPVEPADLPASLRRQADFNVEVDVLPGGFVCSASLKGRTTGDEVREAATGARAAAAAVLEVAARVLPGACARRASRSTISCRSGRRSCSSPASRSSSARAKRSIQPLVAEVWFYPDGSRILELSTKCLPEDALKVAGETRAYLVERGINLDGEQQTKTKTALEFYAGGGATSGS